MVRIFIWRSLFEFLSFLKWLGYRGRVTSYFAFGANLDPSVLLRRCIEPLDSSPFWLENHRLLFNHRIPYRGAAAGSIEFFPGMKLPGVIYRLHQIDLWRLDCMESRLIMLRYQRLSFDHPQFGKVHYYKTRRSFPGLLPTENYINKICAGYRHVFGDHFPYEVELRKIPAIKDPINDPYPYLLFSNYNWGGPIGTWLCRHYDRLCLPVFLFLIFRPAFFDKKPKP